MNLQEVKDYIETNKAIPEVKTYLDTFKIQPTLEVFKSKLNDTEFKSFMDSEKDKHLTKGIETFKTNNLAALVDAKVKELYPDVDPKDTELTKMKLIIEQMQKDTNKKELTNKALKIATEKKLPIELIDFLVGNDEAATTKNIDTLTNIFKTHDEALKTEILKNSSYTPPKGGYTSGDKNPWSKENFNLTKQGEIFKENPELARTLMANK